MVVKLRLQRFGRKKRPYYRVVATDARKPRDGKPIEFLGTFDPLVDKNGVKKLRLKEDRVNYWLSVGAQPTDTVAKLLGYVNILPPPPFTPKTIRHIPKQDREFSTMVSRPTPVSCFDRTDLPRFAPVTPLGARPVPSLSTPVTAGRGQSYSTLPSSFFDTACLGRTMLHGAAGATTVARLPCAPQREGLRLGRSAGKILRLLLRP